MHLTRRTHFEGRRELERSSSDANEVSGAVATPEHPLPILAQTIASRSNDLESGGTGGAQGAECPPEAEASTGPNANLPRPRSLLPKTVGARGSAGRRRASALDSRLAKEDKPSPNPSAPATPVAPRLQPVTPEGDLVSHDTLPRSSIYPEPAFDLSAPPPTFRARAAAWFAGLADVLRRAWAPEPGAEAWRSKALFGPETERLLSVMALPRKTLTMQYKNLPGLRYEMRTTHLVDRLLFRTRGHAPSGSDGFLLLRVTRRVLCLLTIPAHDLDAHSTRHVRLPCEAQNNVAAAFVQYIEALRALARFLRAKGRDNEVWERQEETVACVVAFRRLALLVSAHGLLLRGTGEERTGVGKRDASSQCGPTAPLPRASAPFSMDVRLPEVDRDRVAALCYFFIVTSTALQSLAMVCVAYLFGPPAAERALLLLDAEDRAEGGIADVLQDAHMAGTAPSGAKGQASTEPDGPERD